MMTTRQFFRVLAVRALILLLEITLVVGIIFGILYAIGWIAENLAGRLSFWAIFGAFMAVMSGLLVAVVRR